MKLKNLAKVIARISYRKFTYMFTYIWSKTLPVVLASLPLPSRYTFYPSPLQEVELCGWQLIGYFIP